MTNFLALNGDAPGLTDVVAVRLPTIEDVFQFLAPGAGYLMVLGGIAALVGYISSTGIIGRMNMSKEGTCCSAAWQFLCSDSWSGWGNCVVSGRSRR